MAGDFDEIAEQQGWNQETMLWLCREFISQAGMQDALNTFAAEKQQEEEDTDQISTPLLLLGALSDDPKLSQWHCQRCGWEGTAPSSEKCPSCGGGIYLKEEGGV